VMMIDAQRPEPKVEVILGVDTPGLPSTWRWTIWAEKPGRVERANDRKGLQAATVLGGGLWPRGVRRDRRYQQLRGLKLAT
jgi:hypothetical protein